MNTVISLVLLDPVSQKAGQGGPGEGGGGERQRLRYWDLQIQ